jgi:hypothetical protein
MAYLLASCQPSTDGTGQPDPCHLTPDDDNTLRDRGTGVAWLSGTASAVSV